MYVIKVLVRLPNGDFDSLPIAKYSGSEDDRGPVALQWDTDTEALAFADRNLPGMVCLIEDVELDGIVDNAEHDCSFCNCSHFGCPLICTGCNTTPCDCSDENLSNAGSLR